MQRMRHFSFGQELTYHEFYEGNNHSVYCQTCYYVISGPAYIYDDATSVGIPGLEDVFYNILPVYGLHKSCAELPRVIQHPVHPHCPLTLSCSDPDHSKFDRYHATEAVHGFICAGCRHYSLGFSYNCDACPFKLDLGCASKLESQQLPMEERIERHTHFHKHRLEMFYYDMVLPSTLFRDIVCCNCGKAIHHSAYACVQCRLFIHESCFDKIPQQIPSPFHRQDLLFLDQASEFGSTCRACGDTIYSLMLTSDDCSDEIYDGFHISCCAHTRPSLKLKCHNEHPMFYTTYRPRWKNTMCLVCNNTCEHCSIYRCVECDVNFHIECIPLPRVVKHECDPGHSLTLIDSVPLQSASDEYRCDICENEGDLRDHVYYCEDCRYIAHIECVLSEEYPPSEIVEYLVPRSREESEKETKDESEQYSIKLENESSRAEDESSGAEEDSFGTEEQEWKSFLEDRNLAEIDEIIASMRKKEDKLASKLKAVQKKLKVVQEIRVQKLNSVS